MKRLLNSICQKVFPSRTDYPLKVNFSRDKSGSDLFLRHHREIEIQFIKRGLGAYYIRNQRYRVARNTILVIKPYEPHRYMHWPGQYLEKITLIFDLRLTNKGRLPYRFPVHFHLADKEAAEAEMILRSISEEKDMREKYWPEIIAEKIKTFLILLKRSADKMPVPAAGNPLVDKVQDYLDRHFNQELSVAMLAGLFHVSPSHLAHLFKKYTRTSIKQYILWRRISGAKAIMSADPSVKAVLLSQEVGFRDYALFHRSFRRYSGITLSTYRRFLHKEHRG